MKRCTTTKEFISISKIVPKHQNKNYDYSRSTYKNSHAKVEIICQTHGSFWQSPNNHMRGKGCPYCAGRAPLTNDIVDARLIGRPVIRLGEVHGAKTKILFRCLVDTCGYEWYTTVGSILQGKNCLKCAGRAPLTNADIDARLVNRGIARLGNVSRANYKILWRCLKDGCNNEWEATVGNVLSRSGCPICTKTGFNPSKPATIYVYNINNEYCGYGITNDFKNRNSKHINEFKKNNKCAKLIATYECSGKQAQRIESLLKKTFEVVSTGIKGFIKESTYLYKSPDVISLISTELLKD